jgi:hypothetical protein
LHLPWRTFGEDRFPALLNPSSLIALQAEAERRNAVSEQHWYQFPNIEVFFTLMVANPLLQSNEHFNIQ